MTIITDIKISNLNIVLKYENTIDKKNILVGGYEGDVQTLENKQSYAIQNVSWMLKLNNSILMNNEWDSILYLVDNTNTDKDTWKIKNISEFNLYTPVYYYLHTNNIVYIACYGDGNGDKAGILTCNMSFTDFKNYLCDDILSSIHCIDLFSYNDETFLIAVNLLGNCLYKIDPDNITFDNKLYTFPSNTRPRHFIQIPNTNKIVIITEEFNTELRLLEYNNNQFISIASYNLKDINPYITGAEIKYYNDTIYCTIRVYISEFKDANTEAANGIFIKFNLTNDNSEFKFIKSIEVGKNPRYFTIYNNIAYITNQQSSNVMTIDIDKMELKNTYSIDNQSAFILL